MARGQVEEIVVRPDDPGPLIERMADLASAHGGWVNLQPAMRDEDAPPPARGLAIFLGSPGPPVPVCTWVPGAMGRRGAAPDQIGVQHGLGSRVLGRLAEGGCPLPAGWRWRQDNARRGLVVELPVGTLPAEVVAWLVAAGRLLSTVPLAGPWRAIVHRPR